MLVDLLFIFDVTGSMANAIHDARTRMQGILKSLSDKFAADVKVGLCVYRDHPPQDNSFVTATLDLAPIEDVKNSLEVISVSGGGDYPECVLDGIIDGVKNMSWRKGSRRIAFLIGDAPPHGMMPRGTCLCGCTWGDAVSVAESFKVTIYSIALNSESYLQSSFKTIATFTGGMMVESDKAQDVILEALTSEFENLSLDTKVLEMMEKGMGKDEIQKLLNIDREAVDISESRITQLK